MARCGTVCLNVMPREVVWHSGEMGAKEHTHTNQTVPYRKGRADSSLVPYWAVFIENWDLYSMQFFHLDISGDILS